MNQPQATINQYLVILTALWTSAWWYTRLRVVYWQSGAPRGVIMRSLARTRSFCGTNQRWRHERLGVEREELLQNQCCWCWSGGWGLMQGQWYNRGVGGRSSNCSVWAVIATFGLVRPPAMEVLLSDGCVNLTLWQPYVEIKKLANAVVFSNVAPSRLHCLILICIR